MTFLGGLFLTLGVSQSLVQIPRRTFYLFRAVFVCSVVFQWCVCVLCEVRCLGCLVSKFVYCSVLHSVFAASLLVPRSRLVLIEAIGKAAVASARVDCVRDGVLLASFW